jgi:hypothetical protein
MSERFWSNPFTEPKRSYRFLLNINGIPAWIVKKVNKPNAEITNTEHQYLNHTFNYPAKVKWNKISVTLVDPVSPDASKTMMDIIARSGYHFPEDPNDTTTISKAGAVASLGRVAIAQIGAEDNEVVEEWSLTNAWVSKVEFGELDYSADTMTEIKLEITYDYAKLTRSGVPVSL